MAKSLFDKELGRFIALCSTVKSTKQLGSLFDLFLTIEERHLLAARFLIIQALLKGEMTQREIAKKYGVSIAQITRGSNALKTIDPEMQRFLEESFQ